MNTETAYRVVDAFDAVQSSAYRNQSSLRDSDVAWLRQRYGEYKDKGLGFGESMRLAKADFIIMVCMEKTP